MGIRKVQLFFVHKISSSTLWMRNSAQPCHAMPCLCSCQAASLASLRFAVSSTCYSFSWLAKKEYLLGPFCTDDDAHIIFGDTSQKCLLQCSVLCCVALRCVALRCVAYIVFCLLWHLGNKFFSSSFPFSPCPTHSFEERKRSIKWNKRKRTRCNWAEMPNFPYGLQIPIGNNNSF